MISSRNIDYSTKSSIPSIGNLPSSCWSEQTPKDIQNNIGYCHCPGLPPELKDKILLQKT